MEKKVAEKIAKARELHTLTVRRFEALDERFNEAGREIEQLNGEIGEARKNLQPTFEQRSRLRELTDERDDLSLALASLRPDIEIAREALDWAAQVEAADQVIMLHPQGDANRVKILKALINLAELLIEGRGIERRLERYRFLAKEQRPNLEVNFQCSIEDIWERVFPVFSVLDSGNQSVITKKNRLKENGFNLDSLRLGDRYQSAGTEK